jgi:hypothetical protein
MLKRKAIVPHRNVTFGNVADMADQSWRQREEPWERLTWARMRRFDTSVAAAESLGMNENTYRAYERRPGSSKHTPLDHQAAIRFGRKFRVRWEWLLIGEGEPWPETERPEDEPPTPASRVAVALKSVSQERQEAIADAVEALVKRGGG